MTAAQAARLMTAMGVVWSHSLSDDELEIWYSTVLESCEPLVGEEVVRRLITEDKRWPRPARFNEMRREVERSMEPPSYPALEPEQGDRFVSDTEGLAWVRRVRDTLAVARAANQVPHVPGLRSVGETLKDRF